MQQRKLFRRIVDRLFPIPQPTIVNNTTYADISYVISGETLKNKVVLITGGSSGIGFAIAKKCILEHATVLITGRNEIKLKDAIRELGDNSRYIVNDISIETKYDKLIENAELLAGGEITHLVNNAGIYIDKSFGEITIEDWNNIFNTNTRSAYFLTQAYVQYCIKHSIKGTVVFIDSNRAFLGDIGPYGMSKAALKNYIEGIAQYTIGFGIRINAVAPGMTASEINHVDPKGNIYAKQVKGKRVILPDEIAEVVLFLLSPISKCIVGHTILCDEGDSLK